VIVLNIENTFSYILGAESELNEAKGAIGKGSSFFIEGSVYSDKVQNGIWDGWNRLAKKVKKDGSWIYSVPTGLIPYIAECLEDEHIPYTAYDSRVRVENRIPSASHMNHFVLRPYQERMVNSILRKPDVGSVFYDVSEEDRDLFFSKEGVLTRKRLPGLGIWWSSTGSGKTVGAMGLIGRLGVRTLFMVYGTTLVQQAYDRFIEGLDKWIEDYGVDIEIATEGRFSPGFITCASVSTLSSILSGPGKIVSKSKKNTDYILKKAREFGYINDRDFTREVSLYVKDVKAYDRKGKAASRIDKIMAMARVKGGGSNAFFKRLLSMKGVNESLTKSLARKDILLKYLNTVELLIFDECHRSAASDNVDLIQACPSYYKVGLSGTPFGRSDKKGMVVVGNFAPAILRVTNQEMKDAGVVPSATIYMVAVKEEKVKTRDYARIVEEGIVYHNGRNAAIYSIIKQAYERGENVLLIFQRVEHGNFISELLSGNYDTSIFNPLKYGMSPKDTVPHEKLDGSDKTKRRNEVLERFKNRELQVLIASDIFGTGIDLPDLDNMINAAGGKSLINALQRLGRGLRGKGHLNVFDFIDAHSKRLAQHTKTRLSYYEEEGCFDIKLIDPLKKMVVL
jgi:superfamily II DNA or RNA helicase